MTELDGIGVTTMFAADAEFDVFFRFAAFFDGDLHEFADAGLVEAGEWVFLEDLILGVGIEEGSHVVAADAESGLGEIVGAEAEELRGLGDFIRSDRATRDFDHGADEVVKFDFLLGHHSLGDAVDNFNLEVEFFLEADERDHDLWLHFDLLLGDVCGGFEDRAGLHLGDLRVGDTEAATTMTQHRIRFMEAVYTLHDGFDFHADAASEVHLLLLGVGQEFMKRRIEEADGGREAFQRLENAGEVGALEWQELSEGFAAALFIRGENHLAHRINTIALKEHVLRASESDAAGTEGECR